MPHPDPRDDDQLISLSASGDRAAFEVLALRHAPAVLRLARAMATSESSAEDVVQETFVAAFRASTTYRPGVSSVRTWLFAIARNEARRTHKHRHEVLVTEEPDETPLLALGLAAGWGHEPAEEALARAERSERLAQAVAALAPDDREILVLRDLEGLSGEQASAVLGLALPAMKSRLHRARLRLLAEMRESEGSVVANERDVSGITCTGVLARLGEYVDGELGPAEVALVDGHLRGCTVCERFGGRYSRMVRDARERLGSPPSVDEAQLERIRALLR